MVLLSLFFIYNGYYLHMMDAIKFVIRYVLCGMYS